MKNTQIFRSYELLVDRADDAFKRMEEEHGSCIRCRRHCSDCCHAVFGLFVIEAAYLKGRFDLLDTEKRQAAISRGDRADLDLARMEKRLQVHENDPQMQAYVLARERICCPLLDEGGDCILYDFRPITCRVYGIPTKVRGEPRVCGKTGFEGGEYYPLFDLDGVYRDLYTLSKEILMNAGKDDPDKAALLISVSKAIRTPIEELPFYTSTSQ
jgi:Fe-S-cluster containining protein